MDILDNTCVQLTPTLARCYTSLNEKEKYVRIAAQIAGSEGMELEERLHYHDQMVDTLAKLNAKVTCSRITEMK